MTLPFRLSLIAVVVAFASVGSGPAVAQMVQPVPGVTAPDPMNMLSVQLRALATNPRNLSALLAAGQAALDVGDPNAALGFFARADEIDPRSAKAKAGLASALVMLEKPDDALRLFGDAVALGMSEADVARDRGLAYDLRGDSRRAQRDYALALRRAPDDEVTRRYALSLGISGDRTQALTILDPLLRKQDQGAWRARAFILAMNNDVVGANFIARQVMPASLAGTMAPFLTRLAKLDPAERAHAVNFGTVPSDGRSDKRSDGQTMASVSSPARPGEGFRPFGLAGDGNPRIASAAPNASAGLIPAGAPLGRQTIGRDVASVAVAPVPAPRKPVVEAQVAASAPKPLPGFTSEPSARVGKRIETRIAAVDPAKLPDAARGDPAAVLRVTTMTALPPPDAVTARIATPPASETPNVSPLPPVPVMEPDKGLPTTSAPPAAAAAMIGPPASAVAQAPVFAVGPSPVPATTTAVAKTALAASTAPAAASPVLAGRLAAVLAGIEPEAESAPVALPSADELRAAKRAAARKAAAAAELAAAAQLAKDEKAKAAAAAKANPARLWVQVATGSNARGLATTWRKIQSANDKLLKPYAGYSMAYKATNRVLAGPVRSAAEARTIVIALGKAGVSATTFTSEAGQEVAKLGSR